MDANQGDEWQWDELREEDFLFNPEAADGAGAAAAAMQLAQEAEGAGAAGAADADAAGGAAAAAAVGGIQPADEEEAAAAAGGGAAGEQLPAGGLNQPQQQQGAVADLVAAQLHAVVQAIPDVLAQAGIPLHGGQAAQPHPQPQLPPHQLLLPAGLPGTGGLLLLIQQGQQAQGLPPQVAHFLINQQQPWLAATVAADVHQQPLAAAAAAAADVAAPAGAAGVGGWLSRQALQLLLAWAMWSLPFVAAVAVGRVPTGRQALQAGLVDELAGLEEAISCAKALAKLPKDVPVYKHPLRRLPWQLHLFSRPGLVEGSGGGGGGGGTIMGGLAEVGAVVALAAVAAGLPVTAGQKALGAATGAAVVGGSGAATAARNGLDFEREEEVRSLLASGEPRAYGAGAVALAAQAGPRLRNVSVAAAAAPDPPQQQKAADGSASRKKPEAVIGIDFGTSASGYAAVALPPQVAAAGGVSAATAASTSSQQPAATAASTSTSASNPLLQLRPVTCDQWPDDPTGGDVKTKTALLYRGSKVDAWGWSAWRRWMAMSDSERRQGGYSYLEGFKLLLLEGGSSSSGVGGNSSSGVGGSSSNDPVASGVSTQLPPGLTATQVASDFLSELRRFATKRLRKTMSGASLDTATLVWCVTVPAMWDEAVKQRLRSAANRAGMVTSANPESLVLALEPEAAAVTVAASAPQRQQQLSQVTPASVRQQDSHQPGLKHQLADGDVVLVVDCGGGTADITLHEVVLTNGGGGSAAAVHLLEAAVGKGVLAGGRYVDSALWGLLRGGVVGPALWDEWQHQQPGEWTDLASRWETTKRVMKGAVELQLPPGLVDMLQRRQHEGGAEESSGGGASVPERQASDSSGGVTLCPTTGVVELSAAVMEKVVFGPVMEEIVAAAGEVKASGLGSGKRANKVLLAGGFANSKLLQRRLLRLADEWGVPLLLPPNPGAAVVTDGAFCKFVQCGQLIGTDEVVKRTGSPFSSRANGVGLQLYATPAPTPRYVRELGMQRVAEVSLELPAGWRKSVERRDDYEIEVEMRFGTAEITMVGRDPRTRNAVAVRVDWR
ncbi:hypothetical protein HYH02_011206 [Chlamydomonas schloesseri]|uniref:Uncharacterized protein n=1 Tax=Chlamydomonas schloesseri TaxID=2026947 RepID=A0A835W577_9CHLO|nr:hypothetical protein HYH02_011206 [Chlamydomonas schloesseri]|eukprot:KAG2437564.1 hypothetical protein HYH02_011206 [Chlamydomonas schloesseri]